MKYFLGAALLSLSIVLVAGCATGTKTSSSLKPVNSGIKGQVTMEGQGAAQGVFVYAYDSPYNDMRVPTKLISQATAADGTYTLDLAPGKWFIVARKRTSGDPRGYLVKGDYEGKSNSNPVVVKDGEHATVNLTVSKLEGTFLLAPYLPEEGAMEVKGKVFTEDGKPAHGAYVMLYTDKEMMGLPAYLSRSTDPTGDYSIVLPKTGVYYVAARLKYGGLPKKGEPYGTYDKDPEHKVVIERDSSLTGIDIKLGPFPFDLVNVKPTPVEPASGK
jgi:hypothetical protein